MFLFQKERINVAVARSQSKVVLFVNRDLGYHLPHDPAVTESSKTSNSVTYFTVVNKILRLLSGLLATPLLSKRVIGHTVVQNDKA